MTENTSNTTNNTTNSTRNGEPGSAGSSSRFWQNFKAFLDDAASGISRLVEKGNRRQLIIRSKENQTLLRLPLTLAVVLVLAMALLRLLPLLIIGIVVALVLKVQFVVSTDRPTSD